MERSRPIENAIETKATTSPGYAIAYALLRLADTQAATAAEIRKLGLADATTPFGAIEALTMAVEKIADAIGESAR